jgi:hypothetical protein
VRPTREQRKSRLMEQAEQVIDELLDWTDDTVAPNLTQIEDIVLALRQRLSEQMAQEVVEAQAARQPAPGVLCPHCGQEMRYKGRKAIRPRTWVGDVQIARGYYYCPACKVGFFPLDEQLGLEDTRYSPSVVRELVWLSGEQGSFARAEEVCERIGHLGVSDSSIWRRKDRLGERFRQVEDAQREQAHTLGSVHTFRQQVMGASQRQGVGMDGTMVHIRQEGWKELKVGACFDVVTWRTWAPQGKEWEERPHAEHNQYVAYLGGGRRPLGSCCGRRPSGGDGSGPDPLLRWLSGGGLVSCAGAPIGYGRLAPRRGDARGHALVQISGDGVISRPCGADGPGGRRGRGQLPGSDSRSVTGRSGVSLPTPQTDAVHGAT